MSISTDPSQKTKISKYMSYLLRHNPEGLKMNREGFVDLNKLMLKLGEKYYVNRDIIIEITDQSARKRFEIADDKIRALYGHSIEIRMELQEDKIVKFLYHGTTSESASRILKIGLKPMKRKWVHLSPTKEMAIEVGKRRTTKPIVLEINAEEARRNKLKIFKATECVFLCRKVSPNYIKLA
ncbi:MAG: RNA 2'-phosphotransferase [Candidatus Bathyarchaeia archaeon]